MLSGESGLASVLNLVAFQFYLQIGSSLGSLQDPELHWPEISCSWVGPLDVSCVSFAFYFPLYGWSDVLPSVTPRHSIQQLGVCRESRTAWHRAELCRRAPKSPWDGSAPQRDRALALHKGTSLCTPCPAAGWGCSRLQQSCSDIICQP